MKKIYLSGINKNKFAIVDNDDYEYLSNFNWHYSIGYAYRSKRIGNKIKNIRMHREILGLDSEKLVDHINGNKLDNRKKNIRSVTPSQNTWNIQKVRAKSGFKGVRQNPRGYTWTASICKNDKRIYIANFKTKLEAAAAYNSVAYQLFGNYAGVNQL